MTTKSGPTRSGEWLLVAQNILHLERTKVGAITWWCVKSDSAVGDKCFLYRSLTGVVLYFEIIRFAPQSEGFCSAYQMATAQVKILKMFEPPITARALRRSPELKEAGFVRRNFQGKAFVVGEGMSTAILKLGQISAKL